MKDQGSMPQDNEDDSSEPTYTALEIDYALFEKMLDESQWNDEQKREFIETMWSIVVAFVDLGFNVHPAQQAKGDCGQIEDSTGLEERVLLSSWEDAQDPQKTSATHDDALEGEAS